MRLRARALLELSSELGDWSLSSELLLLPRRRPRRSAHEREESGDRRTVWPGTRARRRCVLESLSDGLPAVSSVSAVSTVVALAVSVVQATLVSRLSLLPARLRSSSSSELLVRLSRLSRSASSRCLRSAAAPRVASRCSGELRREWCTIGALRRALRRAGSGDRGACIASAWPRSLRCERAPARPSESLFGQRQCGAARSRSYRRGAAATIST